MAGTIMGKVWLFNSETRQSELLCGYSEEGVRGLYMDADTAYATIGEGCRSWKRTKPHSAKGNVSFRSLDKKSAHNVKHVLQRGRWACVLFPISSAVVNVRGHEHHHRAFRLFDFGGSLSDVAPCDFDGESLVLVDRSQLSSPPIFRLVQLERNEHVEIDQLPGAAFASHVKLWGKECLVVTVGTVCYLYSYRSKMTMHTLKGHSAEIVALDASDPDFVATMSMDAVVKVWNGSTGECLRTLNVPEATFFLGYPYYLAVQERTVLVSADQGAYLMELDPAGSGDS